MGRPTATRPRAAGLRREMRALADPERARAARRYFKSGPGDYGEGDRFLGLRAAEIHDLARRHASLSRRELDELLRSPWHEHRSVALVILGGQFRRADDVAQAAIVRFYLARTARVNNWDLVDGSAPQILGAHLLDRPRGALTRLARSPNVWERRIAVLATLAFIRRGECDDTLRMAARLLGDPHDLIHKAVGWMLREVGKRDLRALREFLDRQAPRMPRTMLRYAIERLPAAERRRYLTMERRWKGGTR